MCLSQFSDIKPSFLHWSIREGYSMVKASNLLCPPRLGMRCTSKSKLSLMQYSFALCWVRNKEVCGNRWFNLIFPICSKSFRHILKPLLHDDQYDKACMKLSNVSYFEEWNLPNSPFV